MKGRSTAKLLFTESCRLVRGALSLAGNTSRSSKPKCICRCRVGFDGGHRYLPEVLMTQESYKTTAYDTRRAAGCESCGNIRWYSEHDSPF